MADKSKLQSTGEKGKMPLKAYIRKYSIHSS